jgi:dTDP-4-dehydrorhamnose reductase
VGTHFNRKPECESVALDIRDAPAVARAFDSIQPDRVIHTAYDQADPVATHLGAANVAVAAARLRARLVHVSTDIVFSGRLGRPYREGDRADPVTQYGAAKAAAEHAVVGRAPGAAIVRTSLLVAGRTPSNHELTALEAADGRAAYGFYTDELRCPIAVADAAAALVEIAHLQVAGRLHVAGADAVSRYEFACIVARAHGRPVDAIPATEGAAAAGRPADCRLDSTRARRLLRTPLRGIRHVLMPQ